MVIITKLFKISKFEIFSTYGIENDTRIVKWKRNTAGDGITSEILEISPNKLFDVVNTDNQTVLREL